MRSVLKFQRGTYKQKSADGSEERNAERIPHRHGELCVSDQQYTKRNFDRIEG